MTRHLGSTLILLFVAPIPLLGQQLKPVELPSGLPNNILSMAVCSRNKFVATYGHLRLQVWNLATGQKASDLGQLEKPIRALAFSPDDTLLATGGDDGVVRVWDVAAGKVKYEWEWHRHIVWTIAFSQDGKTLGAASSNDATVWDLPTGKELTSIAWRVPARAPVFSRDLRTLVTTDHNDVVVWDVPAKKERLLEGHRGLVVAAAFDLAEKRLFTASTRTRPDDSDMSEIRVWEVASGKEAAVWESPLPTVQCLAVSPDGKLLAVTGGDHYYSQSTLRLIDTTSGRAVPDLELTAQMLQSCFRSNGNWVLGAVNDELRMWEIVPAKK